MPIPAPNSTGIQGQRGGRGAPSVLNRAYSLAQFWDGRAPTLEEQARYKAGNKAALTPSQVRGMDGFFNKSKCDQCHEGINFTSNSYHNPGVSADQPNPDVGRFEVTKDPKDWGAFKIACSAPDMHDGSLKTLEDVIEFYDKGGKASQNLDEKIKPLKLTDGQKMDLVAFLKSLNGEGRQKVAAPAAFPQ